MSATAEVIGAVDPDVRAFFAEFERAGNTHDAEATQRQFAEVFLNADPDAAQPVLRSLLLASLPQRRQLFASIGLRRTRLTSLAQTTLDTHYVLAEAMWVAELDDGDELPLSSTFMLRREGKALQVVLYLNHLDIIAVIRARSSAAPHE